MNINVSSKNISIEKKEIIKTGNLESYEVNVTASEEYEKCACFVVIKYDDERFKIPVIDGKIKLPILLKVPEDKKIYIGFYGAYFENDEVKEINSANFDYLTVVEGSFKKGIPTQEEISTGILDRYLQAMKEFYRTSNQEFEDSVTEAKDDINTARTGAINDIVLEKNSAVSAINSAKTDALGELNDSKESAINEIVNLNNGLKTRVASLESGKVDKEAGKQLSDENYTSAEKNKLAGLENYDDTSIKANVKAIQDDLANYYRKNETYSKIEVDQMISVIPKFAIQVVDSLPTTEISPTTIYLLRTGTESANVFTEYIYINGSWEKLGTQKLDLSGYSTTEQMNQVISSAINALETTMNAALAGKVDKAEGKGLSTNDYTNEEKQKLADTASGLASLLNRFNDYSDFDSFVERYILMRKTGEIFGTLFKPFEESHLSTGERTGASIGKYMTPATDTTPEDTNFPEWLTKPLFVCNGHLTDDGEFVIDAIKGRDSNFADTGAVDVFNCYQTCYWAFENANGDYYRMSDSYFEGSHVVPMAIRKDGSIRPYFPIAKYQATEVNGKLYSSKGKPFRNNSYANCVNNYHKKGPYYSAMLNCEYMYFQFLFAILFADRNNETHLRGNTANNYQYHVVYGEENVSRVVLTTAQAANIDLYSFVSVGNMGTATNTDRGQPYIHNILDDVQVIGKEVIDENNTALILDCDPVTITENALVSTMHEWSGFSDRILGNTGSVISNTNGKHGAVLCGTELMVGGHEVMGNAIADIIDSNFTRDIYITNDGSKLVTTAATIKTTYEKSEFQFKPVAAAWKYITSMIYDLIKGLPVFNSSGESGSGSATGYCDATTCDNGTSGQRELLRGGLLYNWGNAGLWCLHLGNALSDAGWGNLSRPSVNAVGGELSE